MDKKINIYDRTYRSLRANVSSRKATCIRRLTTCNTGRRRRSVCRARPRYKELASIIGTTAGSQAWQDYDNANACALIAFRHLGSLGRAGNAFYQIMGTISIARRSGQPYGFPRFISADNKRFDGNEDANIYQRLENELPPMAETVQYEDYPYFWGYRDLHFPTGNHNLHAHFQAYKYFEPVANEVRRVLKFKNEPVPMSACSLHWRAGDYQDGYSAYHPRMQAEYYIEALKHIPEDVQCIIFSDDPQAAQRLFNVVENHTGRKFLMGVTGDYIDDFMLMKNCKHHIICNSSFSAMAATLSNQGGVVVSPSGDNWFGAAAVGMNNFDIMAPHWKQIKIF